MLRVLPVVTRDESLSPTWMTLVTTGLQLVCAQSIMRRLRLRRKDALDAKTTEDESAGRSA